MRRFDVSFEFGGLRDPQGMRVGDRLFEVWGGLGCVGGWGRGRGCDGDRGDGEKGQSCEGGGKLRVQGWVGPSGFGEVYVRGGRRDYAD